MRVLLTIAFLLIAVQVSAVDTTRAVIHHTASHDVSAAEIDRWHKQNTYIDKNGKERHWDGIGYHFVIRTDGTIEKGRDIQKQGAHAKGRNDRLGIVLTGYDKLKYNSSVLYIYNRDNPISEDKINQKAQWDVHQSVSNKTPMKQIENYK